MKGTPLHAATVVGDTVGDPFKDTSSVALNPVIKFTTLFGLLAVSLAVNLAQESWPWDRARPVGDFLRTFDGFRLAFVLRDADRVGEWLAGRARQERGRDEGVLRNAGVPPWQAHFANPGV